MPYLGILILQVEVRCPNTAKCRKQQVTDYPLLVFLYFQFFIIYPRTITEMCAQRFKTSLYNLLTIKRYEKINVMRYNVTDDQGIQLHSWELFWRSCMNLYLATNTWCRIFHLHNNLVNHAYLHCAIRYSCICDINICQVVRGQLRLLNMAPVHFRIDLNKIASRFAL